MDWVKEAKNLFRALKPVHFTDYTHCSECAEHDRTLLSVDVDTISLNELRYPGWDPICFCTAAGKKYYLPAFIRLSLDSIAGEFYLEQFLFHLTIDAEQNQLLQSCSREQRAFVVSFLNYMVEAFAEEIDRNFCADDMLSACDLWSIAP